MAVFRRCIEIPYIHWGIPGFSQFCIIILLRKKRRRHKIQFFRPVMCLKLPKNRWETKYWVQERDSLRFRFWIKIQDFGDFSDGTVLKSTIAGFSLGFPEFWWFSSNKRCCSSRRNSPERSGKVFLRLQMHSQCPKGAHTRICVPSHQISVKCELWSRVPWHMPVCWHMIYLKNFAPFSANIGLFMYRK